MKNMPFYLQVIIFAFECFKNLTKFKDLAKTETKIVDNTNQPQKIKIYQRLNKLRNEWLL